MFLDIRLSEGRRWMGLFVVDSFTKVLFYGIRFEYKSISYFIIML